MHSLTHAATMPPKPRVRIPVHVLVYTIGFLPGVAYAYHWYKNAPTDEEFEAELRKNYAHHIGNSRGKHEQMSAFLRNMQDPDSAQQREMSQVMLGGRGDKRRLHAVDARPHDADEAARLQREAQARVDKRERKRKRRKERRGEEETPGDAEKRPGGASEQDPDVLAPRVGVGGAARSAAAVAAVGALAVGAGLLFGGRRSR